MKKIIFLIIGAILIFGCVIEKNIKNNETINGKINNINVDNETVKEPKEPKLSMTISTDKEFYHSAEIMNVTFDISSNKTLENVILSCTGIKNRFKYSETVSLNKGENIISTSYKLPRCNVCGGIREGTYNITCEIKYDNLTVTVSKKVEIRQ